MSKKNILYVFISGRLEKINLPGNEYAKEFFYGYHHFKQLQHDVDIVEFSEKKSFLNWIYYILNKLSDLPIYGQYLVSKTNYKKLKNADEVILTNQKTAFSMLPLLVFINLRNKTNINIFIMGLFGKRMKYKIKEFFRDKFIKLLIKNSKNLIFLGQGEYELALKKYHKYEKKFIYLPFGIDNDFWNYKTKDTIKNDILFIGNDGMRDYEFLEKLIESLPYYTFNVVSNKFKPTKNLKNLNLYAGDWSKNTYSDKFLKDLYHNNRLTILPIKNTYQPSGQSVTLQSMAVGTPVLITKTEGFWDKNNFIDKKNIFFVEKNEIEIWENSIKSSLNNENYQKIIDEGVDLINRNYSLKKFNKILYNIIDKN